MCTFSPHKGWEQGHTIDLSRLHLIYSGKMFDDRVTGEPGCGSERQHWGGEIRTEDGSSGSVVAGRDTYHDRNSRPGLPLAGEVLQ